MSINNQMELFDGLKNGKWLNSPVTVYKGITTFVADHIPDFERRCLGLLHPHEGLSRINLHLDIIVRKPYRDDPHSVPIGVVSKDYKLVSHKEVLDVAIKALRHNDIDPSRTNAKITLSEYGERMGLSIILPKQYDFDPGDGHKLAMRLECLNSVEGSTRFKVLIGWYRLVCSNGLIIWKTETDFQRRHRADLSIAHIGRVLRNGLNNAESDKRQLREWRNRAIKPAQLVDWVNEELRKLWGFKAATRAYHIARTGHDVEITGSYQGEKPSTIATKQTIVVPGTSGRVDNAYNVSQVLAWLAKERNDFQEQLGWREQIPDLMNKLLN